MCDGNSSIRRWMPGGWHFGDDSVEPPRAKRPKKLLTDSEKRRQAAERGRIVASKVKGGYGHSDTFVSGPQGAGKATATSTKTMLGS